MSARAENGVSGGGLITAVQPAAPSLWVIIADGKFHGVMIELANDIRRISKGRLRNEHAHHT